MNWFKKIAMPEGYTGDHMTYMDVGHHHSQVDDQSILWLCFLDYSGILNFDIMNILNMGDITHWTAFGSQRMTDPDLIAWGRAEKYDDKSNASGTFNPGNDLVGDEYENSRKRLFYKNKINKWLDSKFDNPRIYWF